MSLHHEDCCCEDCHERNVETIRRYREALVWALGGPGSDFRPREVGEGAYYWRKELAQRAGLEWDGENYINAKE